ncbi:MAG: M20/M25/M40 family metallo-hydrolase [Terracidiphilus sp.]
MDIIAFTRELVDIESITGNERRVGKFLQDRLSMLGYNVRRIDVDSERFNVLALPPRQVSPKVVLSTHMDTVPPFILSSEDNGRIYGRGSCDAKGIIAAEVAAAERLRTEGVEVGLLFLVGEERDNAGAKIANKFPIGSTFLINGEPTENRIATASKGALLVEITAEGRMGHSAYPERGESAINKLLQALQHLCGIELPTKEGVGPTTMNIGVIEGGRAPNVIADYAKALVLFRTIGSTEQLRRQILEAVGTRVRIAFKNEVPFVELSANHALPTMVASFYTDIPSLSNWGKPLLIGPGCIHVAHTEHEYIEKKQLLAGADVYFNLVTDLMA